jgi:uncharacterized membrane protein
MLKKYFVTGLLIWLPLAVTLWIIDFVVSTMDRSLLLLPPSWRPEVVFGMHLPGLGLVASVLVILATGLLAANFLGQRLVRWWEGLVGRIPIVNSIYSSVKQVSDTMLAQKGNAFRKVVLVEFPQRGQWTMAFVVGAPGGRLAEQLGAERVTVYVPTAPNPTSGYVIMVDPAELRDVDVSVDEAFKFHVSLGVVAPAEAARRRPHRPAALTAGTPGDEAPGR